LLEKVLYISNFFVIEFSVNVLGSPPPGAMNKFVSLIFFRRFPFKMARINAP